MRLQIGGFNLDAMQTFASQVSKELDKRTPDNTVRRNLFLVSPDKSVWEITVDDTGLLITTKVSG